MPLSRVLVAGNPKARHDYTILDVYEAGLVLLGSEVKSLRKGRASLADAFASLESGEVFLRLLYIPPYTEASWTNHDPRRARKLLLHAFEISEISRALADSGTTLVPLSLYFLGGKAKVELALAKGKRTYDKRASLKERDARRDVARALKDRS